MAAEPVTRLEQLGDWLAAALGWVGLRYPSGDPEQLHRIGKAWTVFGETLQSLHDRAERATKVILTNETGQKQAGVVVKLFHDWWTAPDGPDANLAAAAKVAKQIGVAFELMATSLDALQRQFWTRLKELAGGLIILAVLFIFGGEVLLAIAATGEVAAEGVAAAGTLEAGAARLVVAGAPRVVQAAGGATRFIAGAPRFAEGAGGVARFVENQASRLVEVVVPAERLNQASRALTAVFRLLLGLAVAVPTKTVVDTLTSAKRELKPVLTAPVTYEFMQCKLIPPPRGFFVGSPSEKRNPDGSKTASLAGYLGEDLTGRLDQEKRSWTPVQTGRSVGLDTYQRSHMWTHIFGAIERAFGMRLAPDVVNNGPLREAEGEIQALYDQAKVTPGGWAKLEIENTTHTPGAWLDPNNNQVGDQLLRQMRYKVTTCFGGVGSEPDRLEVRQFQVDITPPTRNGSTVVPGTGILTATPWP
jgi:hypothetical protein